VEHWQDTTGGAVLDVVVAIILDSVAGAVIEVHGEDEHCNIRKRDDGSEERHVSSLLICIIMSYYSPPLPNDHVQGGRWCKLLLLSIRTRLRFVPVLEGTLKAVKVVDWHADLVFPGSSYGCAVSDLVVVVNVLLPH